MAKYLMIYCTFLFLYLQDSAKGEITLEIESQVAFANSYATFTCAGTGDASLRTTPPKSTTLSLGWAEEPAYYSAQNISITRSKDSSTQVKTYEITIFTKIENNGTTFDCSFDDSITHSTGPATLYIAIKDELREVKGFQVPTVSYSSLDALLNVSWSPPWFLPWSHLVNSYTITVNNQTNNNWTDYLIGDETTWSLSNPDTQPPTTGACHSIMVFIKAHTDEGDSSSTIISTGFPYELDTIKEEDINIDVLMKKSGSLKVDLSFNAPWHCDGFQQIYYNFSLYANDGSLNPLIEQVGPLSEPRVTLEGSIKGQHSYCVDIVYWDASLSEIKEKNVTKCFFVNFTSPSAMVPSVPTATTHTVPTNTNTSTTVNIPTPTTSTTTSATECNNAQQNASSSSNNPVYIIAAFGGVLFILLTCILVVIIIILVKTRNRRVPHINTDVLTEFEIKEPKNIDNDKTNTSSNKSRARKSSVPQIMATNPLYEGSAPLYACVNDPRNINGIGGKKASVCSLPPVITEETTNGHQSSEIPPQLPPPRKMSLDSPGIKTGIQLSLDKQACLGIAESTDCNDQYIPMRSASELRYSQAPLMKAKLEQSWAAQGMVNGGSNGCLNGSKIMLNTAAADNSKKESSINKI